MVRLTALESSARVTIQNSCVGVEMLTVLLRSLYQPMLKSKDDEFEVIDEAADTELYIQDIPVEGSSIKARTFWDEGSSRVLIREKFAEDFGLIKKEVKYTLETVGTVEEKTGYLYLVNFVDMYGQSHRVWGYSIGHVVSGKDISTCSQSCLQSFRREGS